MPKRNKNKTYRLIEKNYKIVEIIYKKKIQKINYTNYFEVADIHQSGYEALILCAKQFDIKRKCKFNSFASRRIAGAMIDEIRRSSMVGGGKYKILNRDELPVFLTENQINISLENLKNIEKLIIEKFFFQNYKEKEIASELGITVARISQIKAEGLKKLKQQIEEQIYGKKIYGK